MFVLSAEGGQFLDRGVWCTHKILGVFPTREMAITSPLLADLEEETIAVLTDMTTGKAEQVAR